MNPGNGAPSEQGEVENSANPELLDDVHVAHSASKEEKLDVPVERSDAESPQSSTDNAVSKEDRKDVVESEIIHDENGELMALPVELSGVQGTNELEPQSSSNEQLVSNADSGPGAGETSGWISRFVPKWFKTWEIGTKQEEDLEAANEFIDSKMGWLLDLKGPISGYVRFGAGVFVTLGGVAMLVLPGPGIPTIGLGAALMFGSRDAAKKITREMYKVVDICSTQTVERFVRTGRVSRLPPRLNSAGKPVDRTREAFDWGE